MNKKQKLKLTRALLLSISLGIADPAIVYASQNQTSGEEYYPDWFNKLIGFSEKAEEVINENLVDPAISTTDQMRTYDLDSLLLISDNPKTYEDRHMYFINKDALGVIEWNYYYDAYNRTVKDLTQAVKKENRKSYFSITDPNTFYVPKSYMNLLTGEKTTNYQEWEEPYFVYDDETDKKYIVYKDVASFIPKRYLNAAALNNNKISISELKAIETELNDSRRIYPCYKVDFEDENLKKQLQGQVLRKQR